MGQFLPILALMVLVAAFAGISFLASRILNPRRPTVAKVAPYECGIVDQTDPPERFPVRFFLIAMIFIVFDIEIIFFYPFTMVFSELGGYGLAAHRDLLGRGVRVVPLPHLQGRARLGPDAAPPAVDPDEHRSHLVDDHSAGGHRRSRRG